MNTTTLRTKVLPVVTIILCFVLWNVGLGYFSMIAAGLLVLAASFLESKKALFTNLGFRAEQRTMKNLFVVAPLVAFGLFLFYYLALIPLVTKATGEALDYSNFDALRGNWKVSAVTLVFVWVSAAFGEEIVWRGYFMRQFAKLFGESRFSMLLNIIIFALLFGWAHAYQGISGQIITGIIGALLALIFYFRKYDLWFNIAIHGFFDTIAIIAIYQDWL